VRKVANLIKHRQFYDYNYKISTQPIQKNKKLQLTFLEKIVYLQKKEMPKIFEYLGIVLLFYSKEHEPIHVHAFL